MSNASGFAYYTKAGERIEFTKEELLQLIQAGKIQADTLIEYNGSRHVAAKYPSLASLITRFAPAAVSTPEPITPAPAPTPITPASAPTPTGGVKNPAASVSASATVASETAVSPIDAPEQASASASAASAPKTCPHCGAVGEQGMFCSKCGGNMSQPQPAAPSAPAYPAFCPHCGGKTSGSTYCPTCGAALTQNSAANCPQCGAPSSGTPFCTRCGYRFPGGASASTPQTVYVQQVVYSTSSDDSSFFGALASCFRKYGTFEGRASRGEFWSFFVWCFIINFFTTGVAALILLIPFLAVTARRLHDTGHSGWWQLLGPFHLIACLFGSEPGPNEYGPQP